MSKAEKREVRINRHIDDNSHLPEEVVNEADVRLSSHFDGSQPLSGLTTEEEEKYLPRLIGVRPDSQDFDQKVREYWAEKTEKIPAGGVILDISTDANGEPANLEDWITFQWAKDHHQVAKNKQEAASNPLKEFYIHDPKKELANKAKEVEYESKAWEEFIQMKDNEDKLDLVVRVFVGANPDRMKKERKVTQVKDAMEDDPKGFYKVANNDELEREAEIREMIDEDIIDREGNMIMFEDQIIGETISEAVKWTKRDKNSGQWSTMKARLKEAKR